MFSLPELEDAHRVVLETFPGTPQLAWPLLAERTRFNAYKAEQLERGVVVQEPPRLKGAERKHFSQMSMEELRDFYDTIKQIDRLGRKKKELFLDG
jgi:hypothetical protein